MGKLVVRLVLLGLALLVIPFLGHFRCVHPAALLSGETGSVWAMESSDDLRYHRADCPEVRCVNPTRVRTFASGHEAKRAGFIPCHVCRPVGYQLPWECLGMRIEDCPPELRDLRSRRH